MSGRRLLVTLVGREPIEVSAGDEPASDPAPGLVRPLPADRSSADGRPADGPSAGGRARYEVVVDGWRFEASVEPA